MDPAWRDMVVIGAQSVAWPPVVALCRVLEAAGSEGAYLLLLPAVYWCWDATFGRRLGLVFLFSAWCNNHLKFLCARPRPYQACRLVYAFSHTPGHGLPSGHAQLSAAAMSSLAWRLRRPWLSLLLTLYVLAMAASRLILGVHYPEDVVVGAGLGLAVAAAARWLEPRLAPLARRPLGQQLAIMALGIAVLAVIHPLWLSGREPTVVSEGLRPLGALAGFAFGAVLEARYVRFVAAGTWPHRWAALLVGLLGVALLREGLKPLLSLAHCPADLSALLRYALVGGWTVAGAPWCFVRLGWCGQRPREASVR